MTNIVISGFRGRMGSSINRIARTFDDVTVVGAVERVGHPELDQEISDGIVLKDNLDGLLNADTVLIEFSTPKATMEHLELAVKANAKMIIGTTGLNDDQNDQVMRAAKRIPILHSHNYGIGMNAFWKIIQEAAKMISDDYQIEIIEFHAGNKPDVPSGTGLTIGKIIAEAKGWEFEDVVKFGREATKANERKEHEICYHSLRAGSYRSDHTVIFAGKGDRLEFTHREEDASVISRGVIWGAKFLQSCNPGYYEMSDVLSFMNRENKTEKSI